MSTETIKIAFSNWLDDQLRRCHSVEDRLKMLDEADASIEIRRQGTNVEAKNLHRPINQKIGATTKIFALKLWYP